MRKFLIICWLFVAFCSAYFSYIDNNPMTLIAFVASISNLLLLTNRKFRI